MQLDVIDTQSLEGERHWRVFSTLHPPERSPAEQALAPNPVSTGRFARVGCGVGNLYVGSSIAAALWEAVLARAAVYSNGGVYPLPRQLAAKALAQLDRSPERAPDVLDLRTPHRYRVVTADGPNDRVVSSMLNTIDYARTHRAAASYCTQFNDAGLDLNGVVYPSRRVNRDWAVVLYHPPVGAPVWVCSEPTIRLDDAAGFALMDRELRRDGFFLIGDPVYDPEATPPEGEE